MARDSDLTSREWCSLLCLFGNPVSCCWPAIGRKYRFDSREKLQPTWPLLQCAAWAIVQQQGQLRWLGPFSRPLACKPWCVVLPARHRA